MSLRNDAELGREGGEERGLKSVWQQFLFVFGYVLSSYDDLMIRARCRFRWLEGEEEEKSRRVVPLSLVLPRS